MSIASSDPVTTRFCSGVPALVSVDTIATPNQIDFLRHPASTSGTVSNSMPDDHRFSETVPVSTNASNGSSADVSVFSIYYQNVRGLRTKTKILRLRLSSCDYDVVVLTETWLRPDIRDCEISPDYQIIRCDRNQATSQLSRGGGVLIAVKSSHRYTLVSTGNCDQLEQVAVRIHLLRRSLYITGIYLRPLSHPDLYTSHTDALQTICEGSANTDIIMALGDYNLPYLNWTFDEDVNGYLPTNASSEQELALTESMLAAGLIQVNSQANLNGRLLDLAFVSEPDAFALLEPPVPLLDADAHHRPFILNLDAHSSMQDVTHGNYYPPDLDFNHCDFDSLNEALSSVDWTQLLHGESVDAITNLFYGKVYEILHDQVPLRRRTTSFLAKHPWWTAELRNLRNVLRKARKRYFTTRTNESKINLRSIETRYNELLTSSYEDFFLRTQSNLKQNPSAFWKFVKSQRISNSLPNTVVFEGTTASCPVGVANLFAKFFQTVYTTNSPSVHSDSFARIHEHDLNLSLLCFSPDEVLKALEALDESKGPGVDGIPPSFLKFCAHSLASPITSIFNRSLMEKTFPSVWKTAKIVPIHKTGSRNNVENYRGISLLCCISKVFETLVHDALHSVVQPLISEFQHGFVQHRSTTTNLLCYTSTLFREVESRRQVDSIYIDFSKAFDTVPHLYQRHPISR